MTAEGIGVPDEPAFLQEIMAEGAANDPQGSSMRWANLSAEERHDRARGAAAWRSGLQASVERAGYGSPEAYLASTTPRPAANGGLTTLSWSELMAEPPEPPPAHRFGIPKVGVTVLAGSPKVGKTLLACQLALELDAPILMVIEEGSRRGISFRLWKQASGLEVAEPQITVLHRQGIRLDQRASVQKLRTLVAELKPALVVMDPLNRLHGADENKPTQMTPVMDSLASIAYDHACAVVCIHHLAKPSMERKGDVWDRFRGAGSIRSGTDANIALDGTNSDHVKLVGEYRDAEPRVEWLELDRESLLFAPIDTPEAKAALKVDPIALRAFVEERGQVTADQVMAEFPVIKSRVTAIVYLRNLGCDEFKGARNKLTFSLGTGQ